MSSSEFSRVGSLYRQSGRVPISGLMITLIVMIPFAIFVGVFYSGVAVHLPFLKLRGLMTFLYAGVLGVSIHRMCRAMKFRNRFAVALMAVFITGVSYYAAWAVHCAWFIQSQQGFSKDVVTVAITGFDPRMIYGWGEYIFENGLWFKNGNPHDGWEAVFGWVVEALIIFVTVFMTRKFYGNAPFCEECDQWTQEQTDLATLPVSPTDPAWQTVVGGNVSSIRKLQLVPDTTRYVELQLASCPTCANSDYLTAVSVQMTVNKEGNVEKKESDLFRGLSITADQKAEVVEFAEQMAEAQKIMQEEAIAELNENDSDHES